ncbi:hypothetical protein CSPX01_12108 [Colletotrichum filicis]|nr:hypothetical protein CSPX01_12108 [Colletotrichum filicis]
MRPILDITSRRHPVQSAPSPALTWMVADYHPSAGLPSLGQEGEQQRSRVGYRRSRCKMPMGTTHSPKLGSRRSMTGAPVGLDTAIATRVHELLDFRHSKRECATADPDFRGRCQGQSQPLRPLRGQRRGYIHDSPHQNPSLPNKMQAHAIMDYMQSASILLVWILLDWWWFSFAALEIRKRFQFPAAWAGPFPLAKLAALGPRNLGPCL